MILDELADESRWERAFAESQEPLARLAAKVRDEIRAGNVRAIEMDELRSRNSPTISCRALVDCPAPSRRRFAKPIAFGAQTPRTRVCSSSASIVKKACSSP